MTLDAFTKATEIKQKIADVEQEVPILQKRIERFNDYIEFMDGRIKPITAYGKTYKKAEIHFNINERVTDVDSRDMFDIVEENKKEFVEFLKKCQKNYEKKLTEQTDTIEILEKEFADLSSDFENKTEVA